MKVIAVTGSFGSGKTTVSKMFEKLGAPAIDADKIVARLYGKKSVKKILEKNFGAQIFSAGKVNRKALAGIVFSGKKMQKKINALIHPLVLNEVKRKLKAFKLDGRQFAALEVPLLLESKEKFPFDFLVVVSCKKKVQFGRLEIKGFSKKDIKARLKFQLPRNEKKKKADFAVDNSNGLKRTEKQVKKIFELIRSLNEIKGSLPGHF
ncbi:MAG: dephospho-CoA kinase [Candidatus Diapherotrites archaeon]|nr:dephospho-CoA kinase [Candidatus Diapherotrites archaeon]